VKILLTGVTGQVGGALVEPLSQIGQVICADRATVDLASPDSIRQTMRRIRPALVINPAAYTAVDRAESETELALQINGIAPGVLAEECAQLGARLVHFSTDYVFDGSKPTPYVESDPPAPSSAYGRSKLAGEQAITGSSCRHLIFRTSWVYGLQGANFLRTMFRLAGEREELRVVDDQRGAPTTAQAIALAFTALLPAWLADPRTDRDGIYHLSCGGSTTWCGFAGRIVAHLDQVAKALGQPCPATRPRVTPILTKDYPTPAKRPHNSVLDNSKLLRSFEVNLANWEEAFSQLLATH
jgi:dTDP-4-dehydrorhamnose reductase